MKKAHYTGKNIFQDSLPKDSFPGAPPKPIAARSITQVGKQYKTK